MNADSQRMDLNYAAQEAQNCSDLLAQSAYHQQRAQQKSVEEQIIRQKQEEARQQLRLLEMQKEVRHNSTQQFELLSMLYAFRNNSDNKKMNANFQNSELSQS